MQRDPLRFVYLLTMWCERPAGGNQHGLWRFSLEEVRTRQRYGFANLETLIAFLLTQLVDADAAGPDEGSCRTN